MSILRLVAQLGLDTKEFSSGIKSATSEVKAFATSTAFTAALAGVSASFVAVGAKAVEYGGNLQDLSDKTGISAETLDRWSGAASLAGSSGNEVASAFVKMAKASVAAANGEDDAVDALKAFGETGTANSIAELQDRFERIAEVIKTGTLDAKQLDAVLKVFGKSGADLIPVFKQGIGSHTGSNLTSKEVANLDEIGDSIKVIENTFRSMIGGVVAQTSGFFSRLAHPFGKSALEESGVTSDSERLAALTGEESSKAKKEREKKEADDAKKVFDDKMSMLDKLASLDEQLEESARKARLSRMSDEEKINELTRERIELNKKADELAQSSPVTSRELFLKSQKINDEIEGITNKDALKANKNSGVDLIRGGDVGGLHGGLIGASNGSERIVSMLKEIKHALTNQGIKLADKL